jgi:hypothetical protein
LSEYTHLAFTIPAEEFGGAVIKLREAGVTSLQYNQSPGDSFYFLDPDGHKLEIHSSDLGARMESLDVNLRESLSCLRNDESFMKDPHKTIENRIVVSKRTEIGL